MKKLSLQELGRLSLESFKLTQKHPVIMVADNIRSGHNVGSMFRIADAFAFEKVILAGISPGPPNSEVEKTAIGATRSVEWSKGDLEHVVKELENKKLQGYILLVIEQTDKSIFLDKFVFLPDHKYIIVFGNEVKGVSDEIISIADYAVEIPQWGTKHSINVSVAAGIVAWEAIKPFAAKFLK